jgi:hypothetical protein
MTAQHHSPAVLPGDRGARIETALRLLREAFDAAVQLRRDVWEFAVDVRELLAAGVTGTDLRWLLCLGYAEHGVETVNLSDTRRRIRCLSSLALTEGTCFVLTDKGAQLVPNRTARDMRDGESLQQDGWSHSGNGEARPHWAAELRELRWNGCLVKHFREPAPNQETILAAFEEEGWPCRIDDPLPPADGIDPKRRLHDAVKRLNLNQAHPLLRFRTDGHGRGVRWEVVVARKAPESAR